MRHERQGVRSEDGGSETGPVGEFSISENALSRRKVIRSLVGKYGEEIVGIVTSDAHDPGVRCRIIISGRSGVIARRSNDHDTEFPRFSDFRSHQV